MRKVIIFQHVAHKILGTLNPTLKERKLNIRYVNFERTPEERPNIQKYDALIVLGGNMGVYEADRYRHIKVEMELIEAALKKDIPILGICLGAQLIANVLGAPVRKHSVREIGWQDVFLTDQGAKDPLFTHFSPTEKLFQFHGDTFDIPHSAVHLARSSLCQSQAFRYEDKVYGLQFHLEVDAPMISRWLSYETNLLEIQESKGQYCALNIKTETERYIDRSVKISLKTFSNFVNLFDKEDRPSALGTDHAKPLKKTLWKN